jgi:hypothetical protein
MVILLAAILVGLVIGLVKGGRIRHLARLRPRWSPLGIAGALGVGVATLAPLDAPEILLATSLVACIAFCLLNRRIRGLGVVTVGLGAILLPLLVNGYVPVDPEAMEHADVDSLGGARRVADDQTALRGLGDIIPIPELGLVVSFGDLIVAAGLGATARNAVRHRRANGVPASKILAADDEVIDLTRFQSGRRRQHPVEVAPGEPVPIPMGWGPGSGELVGAGVGGRGGDDASTASPHVPWPWRRTPPPRPTHPTMRVRHH